MTRWASVSLMPREPQTEDLALFMTEARAVWETRGGVWAEFGEEVLLAYEYRLCVKLAG